MIDLERLIRFGVQQLFGGSRRGQPLVAAFGAALAILSWMRRRAADDKLLFAETLAEGESMRITFRRGAEIVDSARIEN